MAWNFSKLPVKLVLYKTLYAVGELKPLDMELVNFQWGSIWNPTPNNPDVDLGEVLVTVELAGNKN